MVNESQFWFLQELLMLESEDRLVSLNPHNPSALGASEKVTHEKGCLFFWPRLIYTGSHRGRWLCLGIKALKCTSGPAGKNQVTVMKHSFAEGWFYLHLFAVNFFAITTEALISSVWKEAELHCQFIRKLLKFPDLKLHTMHLVCSKLKLVSALKAEHKEQHFCYCSKLNSKALSPLH